MMVAFVGALNGWIMCWGATDWFGALGAFAWLPWAWWAIGALARSGTNDLAFPLAGAVCLSGRDRRISLHRAHARVGRGWLALKSLGQTRRLSSLWPLSFGVALGFGLAAPAWLALFDYVHGSARADQANPGAHWQWIVPWSALPGLVYPGWTVHWSDFLGRTRPASSDRVGLRNCAAPGAGGRIPSAIQRVR